MILQLNLNHLHSRGVECNNLIVVKLEEVRNQDTKA